MKVVLALVLLGLTGTLIDGCEDKTGATYCARVVHLCNDDRLGPTVQRDCAKSCGQCIQEGTLETRGGCEDLLTASECSGYQYFCSSDMFASYLSGVCAKTCGQCKREETLETRGVRGGIQEGTLETRGGCEDILSASECSGYQSLCSSDMFASYLSGVCAKTCGQCKRENTLEGLARRFLESREKMAEE